MIDNQAEGTNNSLVFKEAKSIPSVISKFTNLDINPYGEIANLINNSEATPGEVVFGSSMTGIKGHFATVELSTDTTTSVGGTKELFAVSTEFVVSSR